MIVGDTFSFDTKEVEGFSERKTGIIESIDKDGKMKVRIDGQCRETHWKDNKVESESMNPIWIEAVEADFRNKLTL